MNYDSLLLLPFFPDSVFFLFLLGSVDLPKISLYNSIVLQFVFKLPPFFFCFLGGG